MNTDRKQILYVLSQNIKALRKQRKYSINFFADTCGISAISVKNYIYGKSIPTVKALVSICNGCHVSINEIFGSLLNFETEAGTIQTIYKNFELIPEENRGRVYSLISPFVEKMISGNPYLESANFATKLKACREDYRFSMAAFSRMCSIEETTLKTYESSQRVPSIEILLKICEALGVSPEFILCNMFEDGYPFDFDKRFYAMTPLELKAFAATSNKLCNYYKN